MSGTASAIPEWLNLDQLEDAIRKPADPHQWVPDGLCIGEAYDVFFPPRTTSTDYKTAKAICDSCPSRYACLAEHIGEVFGCFGGTAPGDRKAIRRKLVSRRQDAAA
jgi:hypothetical protein